MNLKIIYDYTMGALLYIFKLMRIEIRKLRFTTTATPDGESISPQDQVSDFIEVFKPTRIFFIFNLLAFFIFIFLPQGKDVILIVIEDLSNFDFGPLLSLLFGMAGWAIAAEFGARYKIYVTDNSGKSLTGSRVNYRKQLQKFLSVVYLLLPFVIVFLSVTLVTLRSSYQFYGETGWHWQIILPYAGVIVSIILLASGLAKFYLDGKFLGSFIKAFPMVAKRILLPRQEKDWLEKLYGIYADYVFTVRKETYFNRKSFRLKWHYHQFIKRIFKIKKTNKTIFPDDYILKTEIPPKFFQPKFYSDEYLPVFNPNRYFYKKNQAGSYRWTFTNDPQFYKVFHFQLRAIALSSLFIILFISLIPSAWIGAPGLVCLSFGCWQGIYIGLLYVDFRYRGKTIISARWLVIIWFLVVSFINNDHPLRYNNSRLITIERPTLNQHFTNWLANYQKDTNNYAVRPDSLHLKDSLRIPVIFITAEGGAARTGAFTALFLAALQDSFKSFRNNIFAYSSVSGGSLGISYFNAINYIEQNDKAGRDSNYYTNKTHQFFINDQLSPVLSKMFYADVLNYFWPQQIERFDRSIALEKVWENDYENIFQQLPNKNVYSSDFLSDYPKNFLAPAWFINTTEVESGAQCFISNVSPEGIFDKRERDLFDYKVQKHINYSTAINFSTRFPLISPSAAVKMNEERTYHYVDGGYVENTGSKTMYEVLQLLKNSDPNFIKKVKPYVIQLKFGGTNNFSGTGFLNETSCIVEGIINTRSATAATYNHLLRTFVDSALQGECIEVPLEATVNEIPLNWVLSKKSLQNLDSAIAKILKNKNNELHEKLYLFNKKSADSVYKIKLLMAAKKPSPKNSNSPKGKK